MAHNVHLVIMGWHLIVGTLMGFVIFVSIKRVIHGRSFVCMNVGAHKVDVIKLQVKILLTLTKTAINSDFQN